MFDWSSLWVAIVSLFWAIFSFSRSALFSWYSNCPPIIRRFQLFEFHDFAWFPQFLRVILTNNLREMWRFDAYYKRTLSLLLSVIHTIESKTIPDRTSQMSKLRTIEHPVLVDLCSGSGGPIVDIQRSLARGEGGKGKGQLGIDVDWILTDLYPNITAFKASSLASLKDRLVGHHYAIEYNSSAVDATKCEVKADMRTVFGAFHHFTPASARLILKDAFVSRTPLSIIEATERSLFNMFTFPALSFAFSYLAPFLAPFSFLHFIFTFIIPIMPFLQVFDGFISILRCYSPQEIIGFIEGIEGVGKKEWTMKEESVEGEKESVWYKECKVPIEDGKQYVWRVGVKKAPWYKLSTVNMVFYQGYITASS